MDKKLGSGSGVNNPDHIFESFKKKLFGLKYLNFFDADPGWKKFRIRDKHPESATLLLRYLILAWMIL
jgi:hypothetical protein